MRNFLRVTIAATALSAGIAPAATIIVPDDDPSIRNAVETAAAGDVVRAGVYSDRIRIDRGQTGLTIEALGGNVEIYVDSGDDGIRIRGVDGVTIRGIAFHSGAYGARIHSATGTTLEHLTFDQPRKDGIRMDKSSGTTVTDCSVFIPRGRGIRVNASPNVTISGRSGQFATVSSPAKEGIRAQLSDDLSISDALVVGSKREAIRITKSANSSLTNSIVNTSRNGIRLQTSLNLTIADNGAFNNDQYGIRIQKSPPIAAVADLTAAGNVASGNGTQDLRVD